MITLYFSPLTILYMTQVQAPKINSQKLTKDLPAPLE